RTADGDLLLLARPLVTRSDCQDAVRVNVERDFDLRQATRRGPDAFEPEVTERSVVAREFSLALQHVNVYRRLVVFSRREGFSFARRNGRVAFDHLGHHAAQSFDAHREWRHVQQHHVFNFSGEHAGLNRRADRDHFIRVDRLVRLFAAGKATDERLHGRHTGCAADQDHFVNIAFHELGVRERLLDRPHASLDQVRRQLFELRPREFIFEVLRPDRVGRDEGQTDGGFNYARQLDLGLFRGFGQPLQGLPILSQINALVAQELFGQPIHDPFVEIISAQVRVARGRFDLKDAVADFQNGNVEGAAAKVEDQDRFVRLLLQAVGQRGGRRLVDDAQYVEARGRGRVFVVLVL